AFIDWGRRFVSSIDLDAQERVDKIAIADGLRRARDAMLQERQDWTAVLSEAMREDNNLVHHIATSRFLEWVESNESEAREVLSAVWADSEDEFALLGPLSRVARAQEFTFLTVASVLMMAHNEGRFPPMAATPLQKAFELTNAPKWTNAGEIRRYHRGLTFFQRVVDEGTKRDFPIKDRLEAQSITWVLTQMAPPDSWDSATKRAFLEWRGDEVPPVNDGDTVPPVPGGSDAVTPAAVHDNVEEMAAAR